jgi:peptide/nickel transport system permease protein
MLRRLMAVPFIVFAANFIGFAYGYYIVPLRGARNPYFSTRPVFEPIFPPYLDYLQSIFTNQVDYIFPGKPVLNWTFASLSLFLPALFLSILVGIGLGRIAALNRPPRVAAWLTTLASLGLASPSFMIAGLLISLVLLYMFSAPASAPAPLPLVGFGYDSHLVLPTLALMIQPTVKIAQVTATSLVEELHKIYITVARSFGHTERNILGHVAFRNVWVNILLACASAVRMIMVELIIIERFFNWPGWGRAFSELIQGGSPPEVATLLASLAALFLLTDLVISLLSQSADPRLRGAA